MKSNKHKRNWRKKVVKKGSHRHRSSGRSKKGDLPFFQTVLLIILFVVLGFVGFSFILHLIEMIY